MQPNPTGISGSRLAFRILGSLGVTRAGRPLVIAGTRQRALLAYLLVRRNEIVPSERFLDELFDNEASQNALNSLHAGVSRLRRQLGADGAEVPLLTRPPGYLLALESEQLDRDVFEEQLARGRRQLEAGAPDAAAETLRSALKLWEGPPLAELSGYEFASREAARLAEVRLAGLSDRIEADLALGRHAALIAELEAFVAEQPLQERLRGQLMLALYRTGRQAQALQVYQDTRRLLNAELGLEPAASLQQLQRSILVHDPALEAPRSTRAPRALEPAPVSRRRLLPIAASGFAAIAAVIGIVAILKEQTAPAPLGVASSSVGVIDPATNRVSAEIPVGAGPKGIATAPGTVWVVNGQDSTVSRINPERRVVTRTIPVPGRPSDIAVGAKTWVLHNRAGSTRDPFAGDAAVSAIDPEFNSLIETIDVPAGFGNTFEDPVALGAGAIWIGGPTGVAQVNTATGSARAAIPPRDVADLAISRGELWVAQIAGDLSRINTATRTITQTITLSSSTHPVAIAAEGNTIWVASRPLPDCCPARLSGVGTVFRIDATTNEVVATIRVGGHPTGIAVGEGAVWITDAKANSVHRIDPATNKITATIPLGGRPSSIAAGNGAIWVTVT